MEKKRREQGGEPDKRHKLPIEMVEKIFSMMPFPAVLNIKRLSKYWYGWFRSPQSLRTAAENGDWPTYGPLVASGRSIMGFHRGSGLWVPFSLPNQVRCEVFPAFRCITIEGSVMCKLEKAEGMHEMPFLHVVDLITGVTREVPWQLGYMLKMEPDQLRVLSEGHENIKVFMLFHTSYEQCKHYQDITTVLYDVRSGERSVRFQCVQASHMFHMFHNSTFFEGKLYCLGTDQSRKRRQIWTYDLDDHKGWRVITPWNKIHDRRILTSHRIMGGGIFHCASKLVVITLLFSAASTSVFVKVHELDPVSKRVVECVGASRSFDREFSQLDVPRLASDSNECIYMSFSSNPPLEPSPIWALRVKSMNVYSNSMWELIPPVVGPAAGPRSYRTELWMKFSFEPGRQLCLLPDCEPNHKPVKQARSQKPSEESSTSLYCRLRTCRSVWK